MASKIQTEFIVKHTAREVPYDVTGFRDKNKDEVPKFLEDAIMKSGSKLVIEIYKAEFNLTPASKGDKYLGYKFR